MASLLKEVRAEGAILGKNLLVPPWSLRFEDPVGMAIVVMLRGVGAVALGGESDQPAAVMTHRLRAGDVAVLTGGRPFRLTDGSAQPGPARYVVHEGGACTTETGDPLPADFTLARHTCGDADEAPTAVLTGSYRMRGGKAQRVLQALPPMVVVPADGTLGPVTDLAMAEIARDLPGQQAVVDRLLDLLLLSTLRTWFGRQGSDEPGLYAAMSDPVLGVVLRAIHDAPGEPWSVATLAERAAVSRATLARRFTEVVGQTPMAYLTRHRLSVASDLLRSSDLTVDAVARRVGYRSGFGLSAAFKRVLNTRPSDARVVA